MQPKTKQQVLDMIKISQQLDEAQYNDKLIECLCLTTKLGFEIKAINNHFVIRIPYTLDDPVTVEKFEINYKYDADSNIRLLTFEKTLHNINQFHEEERRRKSRIKELCKQFSNEDLKLLREHFLTNKGK